MRVHRALDGGRDGGGEEQRLAVLGARGHNAADAGPEAHVQHAVRLVQDEHLHLREVHVIVLHEVDQTAGRGHEHVAASLQLLDLAVELGATHNDDGALVGVLAHD